MNRTYEQVFLAIAVRNGMMKQGEAQACLAKYTSPNREAGSIEEIVRTAGTLTDKQISLLQAGVKKVLSSDAGAENRPAQNSSGGSDPIPGYRIVRKIGVGGTATIFLGEAVEGENEQVALKIMHPSLIKDALAKERFLRESRLLVEFDHPNLVKGYAHGTNGPFHWMAMEFLDGESIQDTLDRENILSEARALEVILSAAQALDYLQEKEILHRDIKPGNIVALTDGSIKVCDLGFAQSIGKDAKENKEEETTSGTAQYMSPEQARGRQDIDIRADIYSLGATLYHMVMGELPFEGGDSMDVMAKQVMEALNSSGIKNRRLSKHMHYFIERMMSKEKALRYSSPKELIEDIEAQIEGFQSLEYDEKKGREESSILRQMKKKEEDEVPPPRKGNPITTRRFRRTDRSTRRFRRDH